MHTSNERASSTHNPIAQSFYDRLSAEGFSHEQIVALATELLNLVHEDLHAPPPVANAK
jgi:hypothetical protein